MHETLYLENKLRRSHSVWTLFRQVQAQARREGKVPVLGLQELHKSGILLCIHSADLPSLLEAFAEANPTAVAETQPPKRKPPRPVRVVSSKEPHGNERFPTPTPSAKMSEPPKVRQYQGRS
jgi:hypothetical protein